MATKTRPVNTRLTVAQVEELVGWPVKTWPGNCSGIANPLQEQLGGGEKCYGLWTGPVVSHYLLHGKRIPSMFAGKPISHHAWIERHGEVIDPTRWVFEGVEPYIYYGPSDYYDFGGNGFRDAMSSPPPDPFDTDHPFKYPDFGDAVDRVRELLHHDPREGCSYEELMWLANCSPQKIDTFYVAEVYDALTAVGMEAAIPFDSRKRYR